jgi:hypothetical protein
MQATQEQLQAFYYSMMKTQEKLRGLDSVVQSIFVGFLIQDGFDPQVSVTLKEESAEAVREVTEILQKWGWLVTPESNPILLKAVFDYDDPEVVQKVLDAKETRQSDIALGVHNDSGDSASYTGSDD